MTATQPTVDHSSPDREPDADGGEPATGPNGAAEQLLVDFEGEGSGEEDLTWGQIGFWQGMEQTGQSATMGAVHPMPPGISLTELAAILRYVLSRHQALRTRLRFDGAGRPRQVCWASGQAVLQVVEAGQDDPAVVAEQLKHRFGTDNFDYENEWPIRMAAVTSQAVITHVVTMYLHLALDAGGLEALLADLARRDPNTGAAAGPVTAVQPLEQARRQRTPAVRRQSAASLKHLEHVMRTVTPRGFGEPKPGVERDFRMIRYRSPAAALAISKIATEQNVNTSSALLAMFAVGLARHTGDGTVMAMLMVSNRFRPGFADSVSPLVQISPYLIEVADTSLGEVVARARSSLLHTYKNAYYDPYQQDELVDRVNAERGEEVDFCCFYNDRREQRAPVEYAGHTDADLEAALAASSWAPEEQPDMSTRKLFLNVDDPPGAIELVMSVDTRYFDEAEMVAVLRGIEVAAVQAALSPQAPTGIAARVGQHV
ncbi:MAG: condensation domain-containing protein [Jatrophihabitans sp.]